jgi:hypothetical protein
MPFLEFASEGPTKKNEVLNVMVDQGGLQVVGRENSKDTSKPLRIQ